MGEVGWRMDGGKGGRMVRERHFFTITKYIWEYVYIACLRLFIIYGVGGVEISREGHFFGRVQVEEGT